MTDILLPMAAMMLLTFLVWLALYFTRVRGMMAQRIHPQKVSTRAAMASTTVTERASWTSDNFQNQFELPVIFYALCLGIAFTGMVDGVFVGLAWAFVALRLLHAVIHIGYNRVVHRFYAYLLGGTVLLLAVLRFTYMLATT